MEVEIINDGPVTIIYESRWQSNMNKLDTWLTKHDLKIC